MTDFSQAERRGLERQQIERPDWHPDADLLTAFAEHWLTTREHEQVLGHLAVCPSCRELVALAGPPLVESVPEPVRKRALWEVPLFRWGAVAATAAVVVIAVSIGTMQQRSAPPSPMSSEKAPLALGDTNRVVAQPHTSNAASAESENAEHQVLSKPATGAGTPKRAHHLQEQVRYERIEPSVDRDRPVTVKAIPQQARTTAAEPPTVAEPPGALASRDLDSLSSAPAAKTDHTTVAGSQVPPGVPAVQQRTEQAYDKAYPGKEDVAVTAESGAVQMNAVGAAPSRKAMLSRTREEAGPPATLFRLAPPITSRATGTQWRITSDGTLQRSFNWGVTWEHMLSEHSFVTAAVVGDHIWAGGEQGILFFSSDNGRSWRPLSVRTATLALTGNIVHLRFMDAANGKLETSTGETWTTSNGGQNWAKQ